MAASFRGAYPVLLTPFDEDGAIDLDVYAFMLEWYLERRVGGFYANCGSSEMFVLSNAERLDLVRVAVETARGRVPVVATGNFGANLRMQLDFCRRVRDAGADAVVIRVPDFKTNDAQLADYYWTFAKDLDFPLGIYECPSPIRRLLPPALTRELAETGQFVVFKETSSDLTTVRTQLDATRGTWLCHFQANTPYLPESVRWGAAGAMSLAANVAPELVEAVIQGASDDRTPWASAHAYLCEFDLLTRLGHPSVSKQILAWRGVPIHPRTRLAGRELSPELTRGLQRTVGRLLAESPHLIG